MKKLFFYFLILYSFSSVLAQNAADVDTAFGPYPGFNGKINTTIQQPDGKILVGGDFTKYKGITCKYFVRLFPDGSIDTSFNLTILFNTWSHATLWNRAISSVLQPDGKIILSGDNFNPNNNNSVYDSVIRLNSDGSSDTSFNIGGSGFFHDLSSYVLIRKIVIQPDGKIIIAGIFTTYNTVNINNILRLNTDGSLDTTFNSGTSFNGLTYSIALQSDNKIIAVGSFTNYNGYTRRQIIRLNSDGSVDLTFSIGVGFNDSGTPASVLIQPDGKIVVAGSFTTYKNVPQNGIIRLLANGDKDPTLVTGAGFYTSPFGPGITNMVIDNLGNFIVGGQFTKYNNIDVSNCVRLSTNGDLDTTFTVTNSSVIYSFLIQNDQKILLAGDKYISRVNSNSTVDYTFDYGSGFNTLFGYYRGDTLIQPDGKIIVGGYFSLYKLRYEPGIIRLNADGTKDTSFNVPNFDVGQTEKLILQPDGKIIAIGTFRLAGTIPFLNSLRLNTNGSLDTTFNGANFYGTVYAFQPDGKILLCYQNIIRRLNTDGSLDNTFNTGSGFNSYLYSVAVQSDGKIIVVGDFTLFNGEQILKMVRLLPNGSLDTTFNSGEGFNSSPRTICLQPDGKILVGGYFESYNVISALGIVRINSDGSYDSTFNAGININGVNSIIIQSDGKIVAGANRTYFVSGYLKNLVRFNNDGSLDNTFDIGTGFDMGDTSSYVSKLNLQSDGKILVSGDFKNYKSVSSSMLVRLNGGNTVLSNDSFSNDKLVLYPNPTHDYIYLQLPSGNRNYDYEIVDLTGKLILQKTNTDSVIDVQFLSNGIYILKVKSEMGVYITKFIKE